MLREGVYFLGYPRTKHDGFEHPRVRTGTGTRVYPGIPGTSPLNVSIILGYILCSSIYSGLPGYHTWSFRTSSGMFPGYPGIYDRVPGYQAEIFQSYSGVYTLVFFLRHPGTKLGYFDYTRVCIPEGSTLGYRGTTCFFRSYAIMYTRGTYSGVPGYDTCLFWTYSGIYPGAAKSIKLPY